MAEDTLTEAGIATILDRYGQWNLATHDERWAARRGSTADELRDFYEGFGPHLRDILAACDLYPLGDLPEPHRSLLNIAFAYAEVAPHIELYKGNPKVPNSFDEEKLISSRGRNETWRDYV